MYISNDKLKELITREMYSSLPLPDSYMNRTIFVEDFYKEFKGDFYSQEDNENLELKNKYVLLLFFVKYTNKNKINTTSWVIV